MTERFEVPEDKTLLAGESAPRTPVVRLVDVPAIVKQEVERAFNEARQTGFWANATRQEWCTAYLAARFGDAPEPLCPHGGPPTRCILCANGHIPSAPAEKECPVADCIYVAGHTGCHRGKDGIDFGAGAAWGARPEAEKERTLASFSGAWEGKELIVPCSACPCARCTAEREFVREMANWMLACGPILTTDEAVAAARRVVEAK